MGYIYRIYGFNLFSPITLYGLQNGEKYTGQDVDVTLKIASEKETSIRHVEEPEMEFSDDAVAIIYQEGWKMSISKNGRSITIYLQEKYIEIACTLLLGTGLNILLLYRGFLPLHAGGFLYQNKCIAISGESGVGKSTFMQNVLHNGYKILSDDCLPLVRKHGVIKCLSSDNLKSKLSETTINQFAVPESNIKKTRLYNGKFFVSIEKEKRVQCTVPLHSVYLLTPGKSSEVFSEELSASQKSKALFDNVLCLNDLPWREIKERINIGREIACDLRFIKLYYPRTFDGLNLALSELVNNELAYE